MMNKLLLITSFILAFSVNAVAQNASPLTIDVQPPQVLGGGGGCVVDNLQGAFASGFLSWTPGVGTMAILIDPTGTGGPSDPGCGGSFDGMVFNVADVTFTVADESAFGTNDGIGAASFNVSLHPLAVAGDPSAGPGAAVDSQTVNFMADGSGIYTFTNPFADVSFEEPFFVAWQFVSFAGGAQVITPLWDGVVRPDGRQFIDNDGMGFVDHSVFFAPPANGWVGVIVTGDFVSGEVLPPPPAVPALNMFGLLALALALMLVATVLLRRQRQN